jgi:hypothetical protein
MLQPFASPCNRAVEKAFQLKRISFEAQVMLSNLVGLDMNSDLLFLTLMGLFLLKHPLANVSRAIRNVNAQCLTLIEQTNSIEINNVDLAQVQNLRLSELLEFGAQINKMRTPKFT